MEKAAEKAWLGKMGWRMFVPAGHFRNCENPELNYKWFGFALGSGQGIYEHEALHACRQIYFHNCYLIDGYGDKLWY